jgi:hypothetical protein
MKAKKTAVMRLTVADLREAIKDMPGTLPVSIEAACSEGCGVGHSELHSVRVDRSVWDKEDSLFLSDD